MLAVARKSDLGLERWRLRCGSGVESRSGRGAPRAARDARRADDRPPSLRRFPRWGKLAGTKARAGGVRGCNGPGDRCRGDCAPGAGCVSALRRPAHRIANPARRNAWRRAAAAPEEDRLKPTDIGNPDYFHKVVDCQWACPAHTPVPEYIRLIAAGRYADAYMVNWKSNVFPGILGRTCDRPCEPACRRGRVEERKREARAGRDLPPEARRRRQQGRHRRPPAASAGEEERQAHRLHRRRARLAHRRARSGAARLRGHTLRRATRRPAA